MAFSEDASVFLDDFGVPVQWKNGDALVVTVAIFDQPGKELNVGYPVMGTDYAITYETSSLEGIKSGDEITVDGKRFAMREPDVLDDIFSRAALRKL